jgi:hypothetical protein
MAEKGCPKRGIVAKAAGIDTTTDHHPRIKNNANQAVERPIRK